MKSFRLVLIATALAALAPAGWAADTAPAAKKAAPAASSASASHRMHGKSKQEHGAADCPSMMNQQHGQGSDKMAANGDKHCGPMKGPSGATK